MAAEPQPKFTVRVVAWIREKGKLRAARIAVFFVEQNTPEEIKWGEFDAMSTHALAEDATGSPIGCGRLLPDGRIGRTAVLSDLRGRSVGAALFTCLIEVVRARGDARMLLNAQTQATPFYARFGFEPIGHEFVEARVPHWAMAHML